AAATGPARPAWFRARAVVGTVFHRRARSGRALAPDPGISLRPRLVARALPLSADRGGRHAGLARVEAVPGRRQLARNCGDLRLRRQPGRVGMEEEAGLKRHTAASTLLGCRSQLYIIAT